MIRWQHSQQPDRQLRQNHLFLHAEYRRPELSLLSALLLLPLAQAVQSIAAAEHRLVFLALVLQRALAPRQTLMNCRFQEPLQQRPNPT
ncbi:hypothetical protein AB664_24155 [Brucella anthropi]|uniref:Uncharacterized protein n=1 Tax=Brucella anthropi TaxID=529 RepID=A0A656Z6B4_BRUAN|nr:hypothetical protein AB664_24155 [Brucella anthropi]